MLTGGGRADSDKPKLRLFDCDGFAKHLVWFSLPTRIGMWSKTRFGKRNLRTVSLAHQSRRRGVEIFGQSLAVIYDLKGTVVQAQI
jgi:hypothetical protein